MPLIPIVAYCASCIMFAVIVFRRPAEPLVRKVKD